MKHLITVIVMLASFAASAQIGVDAIAKQRARDVANQNNNRNVDGPPTTPAPAAARPAATTAAPAATPLNASQQAYAHFQSDLFAMNTNSNADGKQALAKDMTAVAQGANKPSQATLTKLADHLTVALGEAKLTPAKKTRLTQDVSVLMNSASTPAAQKQAMIKDVQSILETGGSSNDNASAVAADLQSAADELVKPAAK